MHMLSRICILLKNKCSCSGFKLQQFVLLFPQEDICPLSEKTLEIVESCPRNNVTIRQRSERKNCSKYEPCQGDPLVYHCLRSGKRLVEVCAPMEIITGKHCCLCSIFNRMVSDLQSCRICVCLVYVKTIK